MGNKTSRNRSKRSLTLSGLSDLDISDMVVKPQNSFKRTNLKKLTMKSDLIYGKKPKNVFKSVVVGERLKIRK